MGHHQTLLGCIRVSACTLLLTSCIAGTGGGGAGTGTDPSLPCTGKCDGVGEGPAPYEYIVVGSGAGGGPLAVQLARAGHRTLLLEAGDYTGPNLTYDIPAFHPRATED